MKQVAQNGQLQRFFRILNDRTYLGMLVQGKSATVNYKVKELKVKPEEEWVVAKNTHDAIISELDFELVQKIMRLDTRTTPNGNSVYTFSGVVICGCCGALNASAQDKI